MVLEIQSCNEKKRLCEASRYKRLRPYFCKRKVKALGKVIRNFFLDTLTIFENLCGFSETTTLNLGYKKQFKKLVLGIPLSERLHCFFW